MVKFESQYLTSTNFDKAYLFA